MQIFSRKIILAFIAIVILALGFYHYRTWAVMADLESRPFNMGLTGSVKNVDPALLDNDAEKTLASMVFEPLVTYSEEKEELRPNLAQKWTCSADGLIYTIFLNSEAEFHNGQKLCAQDVKKSWERNFSICKDWPSLSLFNGISGFNERLQGKNAEIWGIQVTADDSLTITLEEPNFIFMKVLTHPVFWVYTEGDTGQQGSGPFIIRENSGNQNLILVRNEKYHQGPASVTAVNVTIYSNPEAAWQEYINGQLDLLDTVPLKELEMVSNDAKYKGMLKERELFDTYTLGINLNQEPFKDNYLLRRALNYAVDRQEIIDKVWGGHALPLKGVLPQGIAGYNTTARGYNYDPEKAKTLLREAGYDRGAQLNKLNLYFNDNPGHQTIAELVAQQLAQIGINVRLVPMEWNAYKQQLQSNKLDFFRLEWRADYNDADSFLYSLFHSSKIGLTNFTQYSNQQVDKLLSEARGRKSEKERQKLLGKAEEIIIDDAPCVWLFQRKCTIITGPQVRNLYVNGQGLIDWRRVELHKTTATVKV